MNRISLIGLLGLLGLLGLPLNNPGFYGFFGFFGFFAFRNILPDERLQINVNKAARNSFFTGIVLFPVIVIWGALSTFSQAYAAGFAINFAIQIVVFTWSLTRYEQDGEDS